MVGEGLDGVEAGGWYLLDRLGLLGVVGGLLDEGGDLRVGGVSALGAEEAGVLAVLGEVDELVGFTAAHGAGVGEGGHGGDAAAVEDAGVGLVHLAVGDIEAFEVGVEGVEVFHGELAEADEAAAGAGFVAELLLYLVDEEGEVAVGVDVALEQLDDDLFVGGAEDELAVALVGEAEEDVLHGLVAAGGLPDLDGMDGGQHELLAAGGVHLFADDAFDVVEGAPGEGEEGVDAGGDLVDEAGAEEELVGGGLRLCGGLAEGFAEELGHAHGEPMVREGRAEGQGYERSSSNSYLGIDGGGGAR